MTGHTGGSGPLMEADMSGARGRGLAPTCTQNARASAATPPRGAGPALARERRPSGGASSADRAPGADIASVLGDSTARDGGGSSPPRDMPMPDSHHREHTQDAVSGRERLSAGRLAITWMGFPFILAITMTGSVLVLTAGLRNAVLATIIGSLAMFAYVGTLGEWGWRFGQSFAQIAQGVYGARGYRIISGLLSTLVLGWFAINTAMPAEILASAYHIPYPLTATILGILYVAITATGIVGLSRLSLSAVPVYVALLLYAFLRLDPHATSGAPPAWPAPIMGFWPALSAVLAAFADSGTLAPDFNRWAKTRAASWTASACGFPLGFGLAMGLGEFFTESLRAAHTHFLQPFQNGNPVGYLLAFGGLPAALAVAVAVLNQGSNATHCLYNSTVGTAKLMALRYRATVPWLGLLGVVIAASGVWKYLLDWLQLIGFAVPPIGGALIARYRALLKRTGATEATDLSSHAPWIGTAIGWMAGGAILLTHTQAAAPLALVTFAAAFLTTSLLDARIASNREPRAVKS